MAHRAPMTYDGVVEAARQAPVNGVDETGSWATAVVARGSECEGIVYEVNPLVHGRPAAAAVTKYDWD
jgi:hypothetical protein